MFIPIILGTARQGRNSEKAARFVLAEAENFGFQSELIDPREYLSKAETWADKESEKIIALRPKIRSADGIIIVSPEYNHGYPGELKMLLDSLYEEYAGKPVAICGVSIGMLGGSRMVEQMRQVCVEFHMLPVREAVYFANVGDLFDGEGKIKDVSYLKRMETLFKELKNYAEKLTK